MKRVPPFGSQVKGAPLVLRRKEPPALWFSGEKSPPFGYQMKRVPLWYSGEKGPPFCPQVKRDTPWFSGEKGPPLWYSGEKGPPVGSQKKRVHTLVLR